MPLIFMCFKFIFSVTLLDQPKWLDVDTKVDNANVLIFVFKKGDYQIFASSNVLMKWFFLWKYTMPN
jgi:hypothetical protein